MIPELALSIKEPWCSLIVFGHKRIENRVWPTKYRGRILLHAGKADDRDALADVLNGVHPVTGYRVGQQALIASHERFLSLAMGAYRGGIVGSAMLVDCVEEHDSEWFVGPYGFVLADVRPLPFTPLRGQLGLFRHGLTDLAA